ncbi:hypothetical protein IQ273_25280, partial [Nodosilinea sp. LEGE 07298]|uniref:hypothetical protein n=1 Tax=Nodosilinea sp. LEGE 07298 TaxID=2777970 RepID=UPI0018815008
MRHHPSCFAFGIALIAWSNVPAAIAGQPEPSRALGLSPAIAQSWQFETTNTLSRFPIAEIAPDN